MEPTPTPTPVAPITSSPNTLTTLATPIAIVVAGALIGVAVYLSSGSGPAQVAQQPDQQGPQVVDMKKITIAGEPFIGSATAPVTIAYWYDYQCPFCKQNEQTSMPQIIADYVNTGKAKVVFKDFAFLGPDSMTLGQYSHAVWDYAPDKFGAWHTAMFNDQGTENTGWATRDEIIKVTTSVLGADGAAKVAALVAKNGPAYQKAMDADRSEGAAVGVTGTPAFVINGKLLVGAEPYATLKQAIDASLK